MASAVLFFGVAAMTAILTGADFWTAVLRGLVAGAVAAVFTFFPVYLIFSEPLPRAKAPAGAEHLEETFAPHPEAVGVKKPPVKKEPPAEKEEH